MSDDAKALSWLETRRKELLDELCGLQAFAMRQWLPLSAETLRRRDELLHQLQLFDRLIKQHRDRLPPVAPAKRRKRVLVVVASNHEPEALIEAIPRPDALEPVLVGQIPVVHDHRLSERIDRQGDALVSWNYKCLRARRSRHRWRREMAS